MNAYQQWSCCYLHCQDDLVINTEQQKQHHQLGILFIKKKKETNEKPKPNQTKKIKSKGEASQRINTKKG